MVPFPSARCRGRQVPWRRRCRGPALWRGTMCYQAADLCSVPGRRVHPCLRNSPWSVATTAAVARAGLVKVAAARSPFRSAEVTLGDVSTSRPPNGRRAAKK